MKIQVMATEQGDDLVERICEAAAKMYLIDKASVNDTFDFVDTKLAMLGSVNEFIEASSGHVYRTAVTRVTHMINQSKLR